MRCPLTILDYVLGTRFRRALCRVRYGLLSAIPEEAHLVQPLLHCTVRSFCQHVRLQHSSAARNRFPCKAKGSVKRTRLEVLPSLLQKQILSDTSPLHVYMTLMLS